MVIRRALEQSAQPLALMHLRSPSEELERMLLELLVGAYRVLDPRRRQDPQSRVMLGRLHPQLADEAVQVAQARLAAPQSPKLAAVVPPPVEEYGQVPVNVRRAPIAERAATLVTAAGTQREEDGATLERFIDTAMVPGWEATLSSPDLLVQLPTTRVYRAARRQLVNAPFTAIVAAIVLAGSVLLLCGWWAVACWHASADQRQVAGAVAAGTPAAVSVSAVTVRSAGERIGAEAATEEQVEGGVATGEKSEDGTLAGGGQAKAWTPTKVPAELQQAKDWTPAAEQAEGWDLADLQAEGWTLTEGSADLQAEAWTPTEVPAEWQAEAWTPTEDLVGQGVEPLLAEDEVQELLADWELLPVPPAVGTQDAEQDVAAALPAVPTTGQQAARLYVETLVRSYRSQTPRVDADGTRLVSAEVTLEPGLADDLVGVERQLVLLRAVANESPAGSAERWVALMLAGQAALLADRDEDVRQAIAELTQDFAIDADQAAVELSRWAADDIVSVVHRRRVSDWIDEQVRECVLGGELTVASQLVAVAQELGTKHRDETIKSQSKLWRDSLAVAQRYAEAVERLETLGAEQLSPDDRGMVGRYWALVRRDWHQALPHLAAGANVKLAHFAGIELLASAVPDPQDARFLADGYLGEAKRAKGWLADSYVVHAHDLLSAAAQAAEGAEAVALMEAAKKLREEQPTAFEKREDGRR